MTSGGQPITWPDAWPSDGVIQLTPFARRDASALVTASGDDLIQRWTSWPARYTEADALASLNRRERQRQDGTAVSFAVRPADGTSLWGGCDLRLVDPAVPRWEIGYWVAAPQRGRSVATRAVRLAVTWALRTACARRVEALIQPGNVGSCRVVERNGFRVEGLLRQFRARNGTALDFLMYVQLRESRSDSPSGVSGTPGEH